MRPTDEAFDLAADLLAYPSAERRAGQRRAAARLAELVPACAGGLAPLAGLLASDDAAVAEEAYCEAFDNCGERALEIGWHAFGENYARGSFLVFLRERLRARGLPEDGELPDHLSSVLRAAPGLDADAAAMVLDELTLPAVRRILDGFGDGGNPWRGAVTCALAVLTARAEAQEVFGV